MRSATDRPVARLAALLLVALIALAPSFSASAQSATSTGEDASNGNDLPIQFTADQLEYDRELGIVTAKGSVEVNRLDRTLIADTISYNQQSDVLTASGNVTLLEPTGDVIFSSFMELSGDLKSGIIADIRMILSDRSRVAANGARRVNGDLDIRKAVYSPCNLCEDDPSKPPLWQVKAVKVFHDKSRRVVEYSDAWIEVAGYPVFYTPFLAHPDPTVERESGLLPPEIGNSSDLGFITKVPYFINIDDHCDATVVPAYYSDSGPGLEVEYRHRFMDGELDIDSSIVNDDEKDVRGHITAETQFDLDRTWRWGLDGSYVSDDTYFRRYGLPSPGKTLTSTAYVEGFRHRNYARVEAFYFDGLSEGVDDEKTPVALPVAEFHHQSKPGAFGGQFIMDAGIASLTRTDGSDSHRLSFHPGWRTTYVSDLGEFYQFSLNMLGDAYYVSEHPEPGQSSEFDGVTGRVLPQAKLDWRLPLYREGETIDQVIEPIASVVLAPNGSNPSTIPNNDSLEFEFDETSLFGSNRFAGHDRVESGSRIDYGFQWSGSWGDSKHASALVGQSYRFRETNDFPVGSGLEEELSDVVARIDLRPVSYFDLVYRTRIDESDADIRRNEIAAGIGVPAFRLTTDYRNIRAQQDSEFGGRESLNVNVSSQINRYWRGAISTLHDFEEGQTRSVGLTATYEDECFVFSTRFTRSFFKDRDLRPSDTILFQFSFKTLGDFQTNAF